MNSSLKKPDSYRTLLAFQKAECVYDITYYFINNFMDRYRDRTVDQMEQAARSGKQNIVEGYSDAEGSTEVEHKLTVIAKGSLEELKEDYRDYLRTHKLEIWGPQHSKYQACQPLFRKHNDSAYYQRQIESLLRQHRSEVHASCRGLRTACRPCRRGGGYSHRLYVLRIKTHKPAIKKHGKP